MWRSKPISESRLNKKNVTAVAYLFDNITLSKFHFVGLVERADDFSTSDECKSLDAVKVCVFDSHDSGVSEQLLGVVVDKLSET